MSFVVRLARCNPSPRAATILGTRDAQPLQDPPELPTDLFAAVWRARNGVGPGPFHSTPTCVRIRTSGLARTRYGAMLAAGRVPCRFCWRTP